MQRIKIGQIGTGHGHAESKLAVLRESADYEVVGVVEPNDALRAAAEKSAGYQGVEWLTLDQLLNAPGLQAVAVETLVPDLLDGAEAAIAAGKHIHLDKPPGDSLPRFRRLLDEASRQHLCVQLGYMFRFSPAVLFLRKALAEGALGQPFEIHGVMSKVIDLPRRPSLAQFRGGMMFELGSHLVDLTVTMFGKPRLVTPFMQHALEADDALADNALAVFTYPRALASLKATALEVDGQSRRQYVVCGSEGTCVLQPLDAPTVHLTLRRPWANYAKGRHVIPFGDYPRYVGDLADLARIIRGEKDNEFTYAHELAVQETLLAACDMPLG